MVRSNISQRAAEMGDADAHYQLSRFYADMYEEPWGGRASFVQGGGSRKG